MELRAKLQAVCADDFREIVLPLKSVVELMGRICGYADVGTAQVSYKIY